MARIERFITAPDGSEVKIVAQECFGTGLHRSVDVYALKRVNAEAPWQLLNDRPAPGWRTMSVEEYKTRGRSELLQVVGHGQIFKTVALLNAQCAEEANHIERPRQRM